MNLNKSELGGNVFLGYIDVRLPGLLPSHRISVNAMYQKEDMLDNYRFADVFQYPRGYEFSIRRDKLYKMGFNYSFPIVYPDVAIGPLAFIKRIKGNVYYDVGRVEVNSFPFTQGRRSMDSMGAELGFDLRAFRLVEVDMGIRYSYLRADRDHNFFVGSRHQFEFFVVSVRE